MKIILSHPYSGAVWWWFEIMRDGRSKEFSIPGHSYYRDLFGDPPAYLDIALASLVVFEDIVIPAADSWYPGSNYESPLLLPEIGIEVPDWGPISKAKELLGQRKDLLLGDPVIRSVLARVPKRSREQAVRYAIADLLLAHEHGAPVVCSNGRRALLDRITLLTRNSISPEPEKDQVPGASIGPDVASYVIIVGLAFRAETIPSLARIKYQERIRGYAEGFQKVLTKSPEVTFEELYEKIAEAWTASESNQAISRSFTAASRSFSVVGLIPVAGTVTGVIGLGADIAAAALERRSERQRWYELGPEISRFETLVSLEDHLKERRLL